MKFDRRRKYYMILDCETATLPFANKYSAEQKKKIAIAKPLIYDLGYTIIDKKGNIYKKVNYLISEIFSVPEIFDTAYYKDRRPFYIDLLSKKELEIVTWATAMNEFVKDLQIVSAVGAYNAMFDFKKAIPFTELYINMLHSAEYYCWLDMQKGVCAEIANGKRKESNKEFNPEEFLFRKGKYELFDIWGLACKYLLNCDEYRHFCKDNEYYSASKKYYSTNAENCYKFVANNNDFIENHTALSDAIIESDIFAKVVKKAKNKVDIGIIYFPFRILGTVEV